MGKFFKHSINIIWVLIHVVILLAGFLFIAGAATFDPSTHTAVIVLLQAVGGSLIATGIAGVILFIYVANSEHMKNIFKIYRDSGIIAYFTHRSIPIKSEYDDRIKGSKKIDIIGCGLSSFREDYEHEFPNWTGKTVRILLLDPDFPTKKYSAADQRDFEEGNEKGTIRKDVNDFIELLQKLELDTARFSIRLMTCAPTVNIFRIDDQMFWGPYISGQKSRNMPTFIVEKNGELFKRLEGHFNHIWDSDEFSKAII